VGIGRRATAFSLLLGFLALAAAPFALFGLALWRLWFHRQMPTNTDE